MMIFPVKAYLQFLARSSNEHGVHSPFVFDLVTKCFYDDAPYPEYGVLTSHRKSLLTDDSEIRMTDLGAGSRVFTNNIRKVSDIASRAGISRSRSRMLFRLARYLKVSTSLELGSSVGLGTAALALGSQKVTSVEGCSETAGVARRYLEKHQIGNAEIIVSDFDAFLDGKKPSYDLVVFDGNHQKDATLRYANKLLESVSNESVWIFDDIHWSRGMQDAWEEIKKIPEVRVTIDTYRWGLVFFRCEQQREDFIIRV